MKLSKNFTLKEMTRSVTAKRRDIDNTPDEQQIENLAELCEKVLQPLRDLMGPIVITSGYRSPALNTAIGGSATSQHCAIKGAAADIDICTGDCDYKNAEVFHNIKDNFVFDQLIWEFGSESCPDWVHVSYNYGKNRKQILKAVKKNGKTKYLNYED